ncbi:MAG: hypothetical protein KIS85_05560 [Anaerolineales bacterium]|nr:hypothetical protein [Anaerolineales bacterium]
MFPDNLIDLQLDGWTLKARPPLDGAAPNRVIWLVHGWTGDERSMWVFASRMPKDALLLAPRAPYPSKHAELDGYSWVEERAGEFSRLEAFEPALAGFEGLQAAAAAHYPGADFERASLVGFSQGAAFCFALALRRPAAVARLAALAGFLPAGAEPGLGALSGLPVYIAHGTQDETVPVAMAHEALRQLEAAGAQVRYCEADAGHKLGADCARGLAEFMLTD